MGSALYFTAPHEVERRRIDVDAPDPGEVLVETTVSAISPGTELLVYRDEVPADMPVDPSIDGLDGEFSYPLQYGYAAVGTVRSVGDEVDDDWLGRQVFGFAPHRTRFTAETDALVPVPEWLSAEAAALLPTVETAVNLTLDCGPRVGERVVVFGAGPVGLATTSVLARFPLSELVVAEPVASRRELARSFGADATVDPETARSYFDDWAPEGADVAIELSGQPEALDDALDAIGYDGRIVVGSWYGTKRAPIDLGGSFHRDNVTIRSSQVSRIAPDLQGRWTTDRRLSTAIDHLRTVDADALISHRIPFEDAPEAYSLLDGDAEAVQVLLTYDD